MASQTTVLLSLAALACLAALASAQTLGDDDFESPLWTVFRERRTPQGRMSGYAGLSMRGGASMAFAGASSRHSPKYAAPAESAEDEERDAEEAPEVQPIEASEEDELQDDDEEVPAAKPQRPYRKRPQRPTGPKEERKRHGGATAIATSYSNGKGAVANSHAVAYGGDFSGGQYRTRNH